MPGEKCWMFFGLGHCKSWGQCLQVKRDPFWPPKKLKWDPAKMEGLGRWWHLLGSKLFTTYMVCFFGRGRCVCDWPLQCAFVSKKKKKHAIKGSRVLRIKFVANVREETSHYQKLIAFGRTWFCSPWRCFKVLRVPFWTLGSDLSVGWLVGTYNPPIHTGSLTWIPKISLKKHGISTGKCGLKYVVTCCQKPWGLRLKLILRTLDALALS